MGPSIRTALALAVVVAALTPLRAHAQNGRLSADQFSLLTDRLKSSGSFKVRLQAALLLGAAGGADAEPLLVTALHEDKHPAVRAAAALALGQTQDTRAIEPLVTALSDDDPLMRGQSEKGLAQLAQSLPSGAVLLWQELAHAPGAAQERGLAILGTLGATGVPGLCSAIALGGDHPKEVASAALAQLAKPELLIGLRDTLRLKDADVSAVAAALLGDQGDAKALPALADALSDPTQPQSVLTEARSALLRLSSQIDPEAEAHSFESDDPQERMRAVMLLAIKGGPAAQALALRALKDPNLRVQAAGASAAADLGEVQALPRIKALSEKEEEAPILRVLQISARRLERKQQSPTAPRRP